MKITDHIYRLNIPYKDIFTTVYALRSPFGDILFDAASYPEDIDGSVVPFLTQAGITADTLKYVLISHNHGDHSGGLSRLLELYPGTTIVTCSPTLKEEYAAFPFLCPEDGTLLLDTFRVVTIPGHTADSIALLDTRDRSMVTGDCLQLHGILGSGDWASNISYPADHLRALEKVRRMQPQRIFTAHDYVPYGWKAEGSTAVNAFLDACAEPLHRLASLIQANPGMDDSGIRSLFSDFQNNLTISPRVVAAMRAALESKEVLTMLFIHYPPCSTCQKAKAWLDNRGAAYTPRHIKDEKPTYEELKTWYQRSGLPLKRFFNTSGLLYKSLGLKDKLPSMSEEEQLRLLASDGMLVKRPLLVTHSTVIPGFREAQWEEVLL